MQQSHRNNHIFCYNSGRCGPIVLIFELDWDINKTVLCTKFQHNWISLWRIIVYTAGHTGRFYSVLTFSVHIKKNMISRTKRIFKFQRAQLALFFFTQSAARVRLQKTDIPRTLLYRAHSVIRNAGKKYLSFMDWSLCVSEIEFNLYLFLLYNSNVFCLFITVKMLPRSLSTSSCIQSFNENLLSTTNSNHMNHYKIFNNQNEKNLPIH
jgi:hypothetical protein